MGFKKKSNNNIKNNHDPQKLTECDQPAYDFRDKGDNTDTTHQHNTLFLNNEGHTMFCLVK